MPKPPSDNPTGLRLVAPPVAPKRPAIRAGSAGALAVGAFALGAVAMGAVAIGALAIGRLSIGRLRLRDARIDRLSVGSLLIDQNLSAGGQQDKPEK